MLFNASTAAVGLLSIAAKQPKRIDRILTYDRVTDEMTKVASIWFCDKIPDSQSTCCAKFATFQMLYPTYFYTKRCAFPHAIQHIQNLFWALRMEGANMVLKGGKTYESHRKTRGFL